MRAREFADFDVRFLREQPQDNPVFDGLFAIEYFLRVPGEVKARV